MWGSPVENKCLMCLRVTGDALAHHPVMHASACGISLCDNPLTFFFDRSTWTSKRRRPQCGKKPTPSNNEGVGAYQMPPPPSYRTNPAYTTTLQNVGVGSYHTFTPLASGYCLSVMHTCCFSRFFFLLEFHCGLSRFPHIAFTRAK